MTGDPNPDAGENWLRLTPDQVAAFQKLRDQHVFAANIIDDILVGNITPEDALSHLGAVAADQASVLVDAALDVMNGRKQ
ncbi:hypothetical protein [Paramicrobacterium agarici]|uniref:hypothetical protein n=1 Tax=Paramicrobacterium agarici TaxID=630514 RepID=UPI001150B563|nr:hypothetical protein [Microbacterium agarici]TQO23824.1 hypothetical protein FB385_2686 [Microbacterium agarici]